MKQIVKEVLSFVLNVFRELLCLPLFFFFVWLADLNITQSDLFISPLILSGLVVLSLTYYFASFLFTALKFNKAKLNP